MSIVLTRSQNLVNDSRRALNLSYNVLNLLSEVKTGSTVKARYSYLADGTKLRVRDAGSNGFDYLGSLTYKSGSGGLQLESASFGDGVILTGTGGQEVNYFLTDHLGSVRVIVDGNGVVKERNDYYPFGARHARSDYPQLATNRFKFNGKEEQVTGDLGYLDYGWRMYDSGLGRWFRMDPLSENNLSRSSYHFSDNAPIMFVDINGMDYWSTSNPSEIARFFYAFTYGGANTFHTFNYSSWEIHINKLDFNNNVLKELWYNDRTRMFYSSYGTVIDDIATRIGISLPAVSQMGGSASIYNHNPLKETIEARAKWYRKSSGAIKQDYTLDAMFIPIGRGISLGVSGLGKILGKSAGAIGHKGIKLLQRFNSVESLIENAGTLQRLKGGIKQGFVQGNANDIFRGLAQQYKAKIQSNGAELFFQSGNIRVGLHESTKAFGIPTLHINNAGQLYKIRVTL